VRKLVYLPILIFTLIASLGVGYLLYLFWSLLGLIIYGDNGSISQTFATINTIILIIIFAFCLAVGVFYGVKIIKKAESSNLGIKFYFQRAIAIPTIIIILFCVLTVLDWLKYK
jgi:hypothetical protein